MSGLGRKTVWIVAALTIAGLLYYVFAPSSIRPSGLKKPTLFTRTVPVSKILEDPRMYEGRTVTIAGDVTGTLGIMGWGTYKVEDGTGEILVLTKRGCPARGAHVRTRGHVESAFAIGDYSGVVIVEEPGGKK